MHFNWESSDGNLLGYCLYSSKYKGCLNREKFLYTDTGFGNVTITIPRLIDTGLDDISLTIYTLQPKGGKSSITIRNVELLYSSEFIKLSKLKNILIQKKANKYQECTDNDIKNTFIVWRQKLYF